ncbi:hypothetical protein A4D02_18580 [Niastella koreensis]|uniref:Uncharacterized protein n=2 Tax=Niastella koreensis TaxID=354356 RepID=G8T926_NIAKG|nr:hypothetical protein [Niastella koreensis]AEV96979.1 hypothetical protein Niako_0585 [Niastella koreensis GR20-10]OQP39325.1 hypothetical protein A4D02_18580 [Niastella koreensis]
MNSSAIIKNKSISRNEVQVIGTDATGERTESDSMDEIKVPANHYLGEQTHRSLFHFSIGAFMKSIRLHERGGADKLIWEEAPMPVLLPGDALVKILASGLTRYELNWEPTYTDEHGNSRLPTIPGHELCGTLNAGWFYVNSFYEYN